MATFRVKWLIDIEADNPHAAALEALEIMRDPESIATVFEVNSRFEVDGDEVVTIDLWGHPIIQKD